MCTRTARSSRTAKTGKTLRTALAAFAAIALTGCAPDDDAATAGWTGTIDTLASGTIVVHNPSTGLWDTNTNVGALSIPSLTEELRLGTAQGEGPELFGQVRDIAVDALGRIYVLDNQAKEIRVFAPDGTFVRTIGGAGQGPGEMENPTGMEWGPDWHLWVEDPANSRYTVYDTTGAFVTTHPRKVSGVSYRWNGYFDDAGNLYILHRTFGAEDLERWLARMDTSITVLDSFPAPEYEALIYKLVEGGLTRVAASVPFSPRLQWRVAGDGTLWFGISGDYRLYQRALAGDTLRIVELEYEPIPVTDAEKDSALSRDFLRRMAEQGADVDPALVPEYRPAWTSFTIDAEGYLWVIPQIPDSASTAFDVFDPDGRYLGRTKLAGMIFPFPDPIVRGDQFYGVMADELGVQYVVRARLGVPKLADWAE